MKKCQSQANNKATFLSQRQTLHDSKDLQKPGIRFATQYQFTLEDLPTDQANLEMVRIKEKYKWKCEEIDKMKSSIQQDQYTLEERQIKIGKGERELRQLTQQVKEKMHHLHSQELALKEKYQNYEEKYKERELKLEQKAQELERISNSLNLKEQQIEIKEKTLTEKEYLLSQKIHHSETIIEKLQIQLNIVNEKENYYHQQIEKLNQGLGTILSHEHTIKNVEFRLSQQVQQLRELEFQLVQSLSTLISQSIQHCKNQEEQFDQRDQRIQLGEELFNRKLEWDQKNSNSASKFQKTSKFNTENSKNDISHFAYSAMSQKF